MCLLSTDILLGFEFTGLKDIDSSTSKATVPFVVYLYQQIRVYIYTHTHTHTHKMRQKY